MWKRFCNAYEETADESLTRELRRGLALAQVLWHLEWMSLAPSCIPTDENLAMLFECLDERW